MATLIIVGLYILALIIFMYRIKRSKHEQEVVAQINHQAYIDSVLEAQQKREEICKELEAEWQEIVDNPKSHCRKCGAVVLADSYGFLEFDDKSYICSCCLGRRSGVFLNLLNDIEYECPIRNYNPKKERLGKRACNVLVRVPFM